MEVVYFTVAAIVLYFAADRILDRVEVAFGRRFKQRSVIFLFLLLAMALGLFAAVRLIVDA